MRLFSRKQDPRETPGEPAPRAKRRASENRQNSRVANEDDDPLDPAANLKRRGRQRLLGAIALVIGAVVILPWVFDSEPKSSVDDLVVQIPDKDSAFNPKLPDSSPPVPAPVAPMSALTSAPTAISAPVIPATTAPSAPIAASPAVSTPKTVTASSTPGAASAARVAEKPVVAPSRTTSRADDPRAIAAFEGKSFASDAAAGAKSGTAGPVFMLQIGAYANAQTAQGLKDRLVASGLHAFTETIKTPQGDRTRLRVGPFASREAEDKAHDKVKAMGLDATVVPS